MKYELDFCLKIPEIKQCSINTLYDVDFYIPFSESTRSVQPRTSYWTESMQAHSRILLNCAIIFNPDLQFFVQLPHHWEAFLGQPYLAMNFYIFFLLTTSNALLRSTKALFRAQYVLHAILVSTLQQRPYHWFHVPSEIYINFPANYYLPYSGSERF